MLDCHTRASRAQLKPDTVDKSGTHTELTSEILQVQALQQPRPCGRTRNRFRPKQEAVRSAERSSLPQEWTCRAFSSDKSDRPLRHNMKCHHHTHQLQGGAAGSGGGGGPTVLNFLLGSRIRRLLLILSFLDILCTRVGISQGHNQGKDGQTC